MFERTEEDIAAGVIRLVLGGQAYVLPTLSWEASEDWQAELQKQLVELSGKDLVDIESAVGILGGAMNIMVDLIASYDRDHKLARDAADLRHRYDRAQMYEVFKAIARHEYPFIRDAEGLGAMVMPYLRPILLQVLARSPQANTSNGRSPTGISVPVPSVASSTDSSSSSSGEQDRTD